MLEQSPNPKPGVLVRTGQAWKGIAGVLAIFLGTGLVYWSVSVFQIADMQLSLLVIGTLLAGGGTLYPWLGVRCPNCRDPWLWRAMSRHPHRQWLSWLLSQGSCPKCGYDP